LSGASRGKKQTRKKGDSKKNPIMSAKSKKSANAIDRPIDAGVMAKAKAIAQEYQVILACEAGHWFGRGLELPNIHGDGKTVGQCVENTREAFCGCVAYLLEEGQRPPTPAREGTRTMQVNVRLTAEEKALLEVTAKRKGFSGLSDYVRAAAMEVAR
jgi:predicted RNase H-like HicB family nuclease